MAGNEKNVSGKKLLYLAGFAVLYFIMFIRPYVHSEAGSYQEAADMGRDFLEEYGTEISGEEFQQLKSRKLVYADSVVDEYIASSQMFADLNVHDFTEFMDRIGSREISLEESNNLWWMLYGGVPQGEVEKRMERQVTKGLWDFYIETYEQETAGGTSFYEDLDEAQRERVAERGEREVYGILPNGMAYYNFEVLRFVGVFMALSMIFMIMPYMVSENRSRMPALQNSFREGRNCYWYRLCAVLLSCLLVAAMAAAGYWVIACRNRVPEFWDCGLSSFSSGFIIWFPWTVGQYSVISLVTAAAFSIGLSLVVFVVTGYLENYITAIAWLLPAVLEGGVFCGVVMYAFDEITKPKGLVPMVGVLVLAAGIIAVVAQGRREKRRDIYMI